jgi:RNA polymerase sigma-70 factor (ECF subfamily)
VQEAGGPSFDDLVAAHKRRVYYLALDLTGSHHDAEDLSQDVFIKAFENLDSFRGDAKVFTWLYRIAVNTFLNRTRRKAWQAEQLQEDLDDTDGTATGLPPSDERAERRQMQAHIEASLQALSPRERTAFVLKHYNDLKIREVAAIMDVATGTVKSMLYRATQKLQHELAFYRDEL